MIHWVVDYCMYLNSTDDFQNESVQICFEAENALELENTCENKKEYKRKICKFLCDNGYFDGGLEKCINDDSFITSTVKNGGL